MRAAASWGKKLEMAGDHETGQAGRSDAAPAEQVSGWAPSDDAREALLGRTVQELARAFRASVRSRGEFDALLVRGMPVNHRLHFVGLVATSALAVLAAVVSQRPGLAPLGLIVIAPGSYVGWWLFLWATGGEELERVSVDERGKVRSTKWGRAVETRSDFLRVAIPAMVIAVSGFIAVSLIYMLIYPPWPMCNGDPYGLPQVCFYLPGFGSAGGGGHVLTVAETQAMENYFRTYVLALDLLVLVPAIWFLWRMLSGRSVLGIRPISRFQRGE